jgi:hypothetical protein
VSNSTGLHIYILTVLRYLAVAGKLIVAGIEYVYYDDVGSACLLSDKLRPRETKKVAQMELLDAELGIVYEEEEEWDNKWFDYYRAEARVLAHRTRIGRCGR